MHLKRDCLKYKAVSDARQLPSETMSQLRTYLDVLRPVGILECIVRVVEVHVGRVDVGYHNKTAISLQGSLEQVR